MNCIDCKDFTCPHRSESTVGKNCYYESGDEQKEKLLMMSAEASLHYADWSSFRREAAKDIACAILSAGMEQTDDNNQYFHTFENLAESAVKWADTLIAKLKQE